MIFKNLLNTKTSEIQSEFDKLFLDVLKNQTHPTDLLLVHINGFYNPDVYNWDNIEKKMSPYMFGPNTEGHSENLHHQFIGDYLKKATTDESCEDYKNKFVWSEERQREIDELTKIEGDSIQHEMLIYLKIWEADLFIKKLYQIVRLANGEVYDWHFSIAESNRDTNATGTRELIIRKKVRDKLQERYPKIYDAIKKAYKTQLRNSIAHSKYSFLGRYIHLNNYIKEDPASQIEVIPFDEWTELFHDTIIIYTQISRFFYMADKFYSKLAQDNEMALEIRINRLDPEERTEYHILKHRVKWNDWYWKANEETSS